MLMTLPHLIIPKNSISILDLVVREIHDYCFEQHRHAKRARVIFCDRNIHKTVYSNDLVKFSWLRCTARKKQGIHDVHTMLHR